MDAIEFLKRSSDGKHRVVSTGELNIYQIAEAQRDGKMFVDQTTGLGWVLLPWECTTDKDRNREEQYFIKTASHLTVAMEQTSGEEALYSNGELVQERSSLLYFDFLHAAQGRQIYLTEFRCDWCGEPWPKTLAELQTKVGQQVNH